MPLLNRGAKMTHSHRSVTFVNVWKRGAILIMSEEYSSLEIVAHGCGYRSPFRFPDGHVEKFALLFCYFILNNTGYSKNKISDPLESSEQDAGERFLSDRGLAPTLASTTNALSMELQNQL